VAINLQAGNYFSALFGYVRSGSSVFPSMGSITGEPVAGQTLDFFYTSTGGSAIGFVGNQSTTLLSSITVDGVSWAVGTGTYDSGTDTTQYPVTPVGGGFADGVTYSVDAGGGGGPTYAGPTYVGKSTAVGGTGSVSPDFTSSGRASGDLLTLAVETASGSISFTGSSTGAVAIKGVTSSSLTLSGTATGSVSLPAISGDVAGTIPLGGFAYQRSGSSESRMWRPFMDSFAA